MNRSKKPGPQLYLWDGLLFRTLGWWEQGMNPGTAQTLPLMDATAHSVGLDKVCEILLVMDRQMEGALRHSYSKPRGSLKTLKKKHFSQVFGLGGGPEMRSQEPRSLDSSQKPESVIFKLYESPDCCHSLAVWQGPVSSFTELCYFSELASRLWIYAISWTHSLSLSIWSFSSY